MGGLSFTILFAISVLKSFILSPHCPFGKIVHEQKKCLNLGGQKEGERKEVINHHKNGTGFFLQHTV
ncbi:hypothetical protein B0W44_15910 [Novibacillus thermophilus]|uniref:Uncharacterized protein n=1 Tax=Novibacillus thermophilus TaxID=1471761 RepID=A0A1U9KAE3_9BACL|nr:hypothetical protein B0W44_07425 [Novibacillus thermophilus]AQS57014.1 hypothetical protein B0W44_15910 [Novibacillus thermophilus]